jgi:hypothetical protein
MLLPEGNEQLALAAEVVIEAANAGSGPLHDVRDARVGETTLRENLPRRVKQRAQTAATFRSE